MDNDNKTIPEGANFVWMEVEAPRSMVSFSVPVEQYKKYLNGEIPVHCLDHIKEEVWLGQQRIHILYSQETFNTQIIQAIENNDVSFTDDDNNPWA